ncbi:MAG: hypothetical protein OEW15_18555 [Nitrospirota bacterium]|nr:hypothetical protein [Nitrospirota bacterium]
MAVIMKPREVKCDQTGCINSKTENAYGDGFPGWGTIGGKMKNGESPILCPACMDMYSQLMDVDFTEPNAIDRIKSIIENRTKSDAVKPSEAPVE